MSGSIPLARHIASLFAFCNSDLTYDCVRQQCLSAGWRLDEEDHDNLVLRIHIDDSLSEMVAVGGILAFAGIFAWAISQ